MRNFSDAPSGTSYQKLGGSYVRASGGAKSAAGAARSGRRVTSSVVGLFALGMSRGFTEAGRQFGLELKVGDSLDVLAPDIIDALAPSGATIEDAIARAALIATIKDFFKEMKLEGKKVDALNGLREKDLRRLVEISIANYINTRLQEELINRIERNKITEKRANNLSRQLKKFTHSTVKLDLKDVEVLKVDWRGHAGKEIVSELFGRAYSILGDE